VQKKREITTIVKSAGPNLSAACFLVSLFLFSCALFPRAATAACTAPAGSGGDIIYNKDFSMMQYCDDTNWIAMHSGDPSLIGYWRLDETSGTTAFDSSMNANHGVLRAGKNAGTDQLTGVIRSAQFFDGADDNIRVTNSGTYSFTNGFSFSVAAWVNIPATETCSPNRVFTGYRVDTDHQWWLGCINTSNAAHFELEATEDLVIDGTTPLNDGEWHLVVGTYDGSTNVGTIYVDGVAENSATLDMSSDLVGGSYLCFGAYGLNCEGYRLPGAMDEIRLYDRVLSASEITAMYTAGRDQGLVGHWKLNETSGTTALDRSPYGNTGTMAGGLSAFSDNVPGVYGTALAFDGTDDYITMGTDPVYSLLDFTVSAWVYIPGSLPTGWRAIVAHNRNGPNWFFLGTQGSRIHMRWGDGARSADFNGTISANRWYHLVTTYDSSTDTARMYIDGVLDNTDGGEGLPTPTNGLLYIGANTNNTEFWEGYIDDVRIYHNALSPEEVGALHNERFLICDGPEGHEGDIVYNDDFNVMQFCSATGWKGMGPAGDGGASCGSPSGNAGDVMYNDDLNVLQYCEGDDWVAIGK
jgi:hypothetical protein